MGDHRTSITKEKEDKTTRMDKMRNIEWHTSTGSATIFYQLKQGCNWADLPKDLPPYSTVYWYYKQWRAAGVLDSLLNALHSQARKQVKKSLNGQL